MIILCNSIRSGDKLVITNLGGKRLRNKSILSMIAVGIFVSTLSVSSVKAEERGSDRARSAIKSQVEKPLEQGLIDSKVIDQFENGMKNSNEMGRMSRASSSDYIIESEYNDDFESANKSSYDKPTIGQLLPLYDVDFHKVVVPRSGLLLVGGLTNSPYIDLLYATVQKDFVENSKLEYVGTEYEDDLEIRVYQAKAGTYYVGVTDADNDYYDDNTEEDLYAIATGFVDNVKPSKPTIKKVDDNDKKVTGKAEASSTVTVKAGSKKLGSAKSNSKGNYTVKIKAQKKGTSLSVTAKDKAGNVSSKATTKVVKH